MSVCTSPRTASRDMSLNLSRSTGLHQLGLGLRLGLGSVVSGKGKCVVRLWEGVASPGEARARVCVCGKQQAASSKQQASDERDGDVASPVGRTPLRATLRLSDGLCAVRTW